MKTGIMTVMAFAVLIAPMLYADRLGDMESAMIADKQKEQEAQRQREAEARQARQESEKMRREIEAEKQRQEAAELADAERKRRYPIEQKERGEYAQALLASISFDVSTYFNIQQDLKKYISSMSVTEERWTALKDMQSKRDWLGMLNSIQEEEFKDFPKQDVIAAIVGNLKKMSFHAEFLFTHNYNTWEVRIGYVDLRKRDYAFENPRLGDVEQFSADGIIVKFSMTECKDNKPILYAKGFYQPERELFENRRKQLNKIDSDVKLGRITQSQANVQREDVQEKFRTEVATWVETSKIPDGVFKEKVRERRATISTRNVGGGNNSSISSRPSKPKWVSCPDCEGTRYVSKGRCAECDGTGKTRTPVTRGIGGRMMGGRLTQCTKCKGKGEIKELCKECKGRGKIKETP